VAQLPRLRWQKVRSWHNSQGFPDKKWSRGSTPMASLAKSGVMAQFPLPPQSKRNTLLSKLCSIINWLL